MTQETFLRVSTAHGLGEKMALLPKCISYKEGGEPAGGGENSAHGGTDREDVVESHISAARYFLSKCGEAEKVCVRPVAGVAERTPPPLGLLSCGAETGRSEAVELVCARVYARTPVCEGETVCV